MHLAIPADFAHSLDLSALFAWFVAREGAVRSLHVDLCCQAAWAPLLAVLGVVGRRLEHLRIAGETAQCQRPGDTAPWLALAPNLTALELDEVVDASIADARFPLGALLLPAPGSCHAAACVGAC